MFQTNSTHGFHIKFGNGWTVSVQWGHGTYSDNKLRPWEQGIVDSSNAEIAAYNESGDWYSFGEEEGNVLGWQSPEEVARFIDTISKL
jgi:hypothetical protein